MFDLIHGLPVHAVVVLLPLGCVSTIAIALRPAWRERCGVLVVTVAAPATTARSDRVASSQRGH